MASIEGRRVAFLVANEGVEQVELTEPWKAVEAAGGQPVLVAPEAGEVQAFNHLDKADRFTVDTTVDDANVEEFDALILPGGVANPDQLRTQPSAVRFVRQLVDSGKPVAVICHGPWTLIDAGAVAGRRITSWPSLSTDITNAGGDWVDEETVTDTNGPGPILSSRKPDDLPAFCRSMIDLFASAPAGAR
jgi:protease I